MELPMMTNGADRSNGEDCPRGQVLVLTAFGHGHLFPCLELSRRIASRNYKTTLIVFSHLLPSIKPSFTRDPLIEVVQVPSPSPRPGLPAHLQQDTYDSLNRVVEEVLSRPHLVKPVCAAVNMFMLISWTKEVFKKFHVPMVGFFTSGACSPAMEYASWKANAEDIQQGEFRPLPGLPDEMGLTQLNIKRRPFRAPSTGSNVPVKPPTAAGVRPAMGPPGPGKRPVWLDDIEDLVGVMFNTLDELEGPFLKYLACQLERPAWGVGPLLPDQYWKAAEGQPPVHDEEVRVDRQSSITEANVMAWLDTQPRRSVIFVSFGSSVSPTAEELGELDEALAESTWPFIWVIQPGTDYFPHGLDERVGERGLIITGWAPQLLILSHPSTGGFLSHSGWNSTIESLMQGVPVLACPIRGDQYDNARLVVEHFKVGHRVTEDPSSFVKKDDFVKAMDRLMGDKEVKERAEEVRSWFGCEFPPSSDAALDDFEKSI